MNRRTAILQDVCEISMGQAPQGDSYNTESNGYPLIAGAGDFGDITPLPKKYTTEPTKLSRVDDIILCIRATIGDRNWADSVYCLGRGVSGLRADPAQLNQKYLWHWLGNAADHLRSKGRGATFLQVNRADIGSMEIPLPPLPEQRRIAAILDKADALRAKRRESIAKLDQLLQSVFLEMFGDPVTNPKGFPIRKLADFYVNQAEGTKCGPFGSILKKSDLTESGVPLWNMDNISLAGEANMPFREWVSHEKAIQLRAYDVREGDILISRAGTVGKMCVARSLAGTSLMTTNLIRLRLDKELLPEFFVSLMLHCKGRMARLAAGADGAFTHMSTGVLDQVLIPYPPIDLQEKWLSLMRHINGIKRGMNNQLDEMNHVLLSASHFYFN